MALWEQVLLGMAAFILAFLFWPGAKAAMERSKAVENPDWKAVLIPLALVVLFVVLLIVISKN